MSSLVQQKQISPRSYIILSILAALLTMGTKFIGYLITGSVGLFSDAAESLVNLAAAIVAFWALSLAARPADKEHAYGHTKAEYFSSGVEGALIILAAIIILVEAIPRFIHPHPLDQIGLGLTFSTIGAFINAVVALILKRAGKRLNSISLEADAHHLLTDVWTTVGVLVGVALVALTGWHVLDPIIAIIVALNIIWTGIRLLRETAQGLLDTMLPANEIAQVQKIFDQYRQQGVDFHALRSRSAGSRRFLSFHVLVPGSWTVSKGHQLCEAVERDLHELWPTSTIFTHMEPQEDPASWTDQQLDRDYKNVPPAPFIQSGQEEEE